MLAVLFRGIENFKMFDMVNLLTNGGPGSLTETVSITLKRAAFEKWQTGWSSALAIISVSDRVWSRQHLHQGPQQGEAAMIGKSTAHSVVEALCCLAGALGTVRGCCIPDHHNAAVVDISDQLQTPSDSVAYPPKVLSEPTV